MTFDDITTSLEPVIDDLEVSMTLPWYGLLTEQDLKVLRESYGDVIMVPGLKMRLSRIDVDGKIMIPGCGTGFLECRRRLRTWASKSEKSDKQLEWWLELTKSKGMQVITIADMLNGLDSQAWKEYKQVYRIATAVDRTRRNRETKRRKVMEDAAKARKEKRVAAVEALMDLTRAS